MKMTKRFRRILGLACTILAGLFALTGEAIANSRPNIVLVQVDDMPQHLLAPILADGKTAMPNLESLIAGEGASFRNHYNTTPLCSPSRSALLSGQYGRSSGIVANVGEFGGWSGWQGREIFDRNVATMLQAAGYHTAHFGKFLNHYERGSTDPLVVPPGWNTWVTDATDQSTRNFYGYEQLVQIQRNGDETDGTGDGEIQGPFGDPSYTAREGIDPATCLIDTPESEGLTCNYHTDRMTRQAAREIREVNEPLFLQVDYHAPHGDNTPPAGPQPATRHLGLADGVPLPKGPAFNEKNTSDKSFLIQQGNGLLDPNSESTMLSFFRTGLESLRSVDEGIGYLLQTLEETDKLNDTYFIFLSDNGFFFGEHRMPWGKFLAYEPSTRVPLLIRGPSIPAAEIPNLVSTADLTPTILEAAKVTPNPTYEMDGRSLLATARGGGQGTRSRAVLIENISAEEMRGESLPIIEPYPLDPNRPAGRVPNLKYRALRIGRFKFIEYTQGGEELYDLRRDPHELYSQARNTEYTELMAYMRRMLDQYRNCSGTECLQPPDPTPEPGRFRLDARKPPKYFSPLIAYLYRDAVYITVSCRSKRPCRKNLSAWHRGERVTKWVSVWIRAGERRRVLLPARETGIVKLQRASEREARIELRRPAQPDSPDNNTLISRPTLRQN